MYYSGDRTKIGDETIVTDCNKLIFSGYTLSKGGNPITCFITFASPISSSSMMMSINALASYKSGTIFSQK